MMSLPPSSALGPSYRFIAGLLLLALLPCRGFALDPAEKSSSYILNRWDAEDGLPQSLVRQILQTRDGYLWVGTVMGLARFDGLNFTTFKASNTPGFPGSLVTSLAETSDGSLWVGSSAGLGRYRDGRFVTYTQKDGLKSSTINTLCVAPDGVLWIGCGPNGVTRWVDGKFIQDIDTSAYNTIGMQTINAGRRHGVWIATGIEALRYADGKIVRFGPEQGLPDNTIRAIREDAAGNVVAVTQRGLFRLEGEKFAPFLPAPANPRLNAALTDRDGNLWIASIGGLERISDGKIELYRDAHGENPGSIDVIFEDHEGSLWIGGSSGLGRLTNRRGRDLGVGEGVLGSTGLAVKESRDGSFWLSSWAGGVARFQNGVVKQYRVGAPLSHETVTCIYEAPDGAMWFGNRGSSVDRLEGNTVTTFVYPSGVATSRYVSAMYAEPGRDFLVAIAGRGLLALRDGKLVPVPEAAAFTSGIIWSIHATHDGRLLVAGTQGLYERAPDRTFRAVVLPGVTGALSIRGLMEDDDGGIWLSTDGQGLVHWQSGRAHVYRERDGMIGDSVSSAVDDHAGSIWITSSRGIGRIPRAEFERFDRGEISRLNMLAFGRVDGLQNASISTGGAPLAARLTDGRLVFATSKGFAAIDPRSLQLNTQPPSVVIEGVIADDRALVAEPGKVLVVPAGANRLEFRYSALSLAAPHRLRFRYRLQGSDPDWVEAGRERSAHYTHLAPGNYTFRVLACNSDGVWNEIGATTQLVVRPFFYQTGWFAGLTVFTGVLAVFGVFRARVRITRQRLVELESQVNARTSELRQAKDAAEAAREEIARERSRFKFIFESLPVGVTWMTGDRVATRLVNPEHARITGLAANEGQRPELDREATHPEDRSAEGRLQEDLRAGRIERYSLEKRYVRPDGSVVWAALTVRSVRETAVGEAQEISTLIDITARKEAEAGLEKAHQQLLETSREAGMAEVATSVLHNVGNVLNSVNVSATVVTDRLRQTKAVRIAKIAALLEEHKHDLPEFISRDARGQTIPSYLSTLGSAVAEEQAAVLMELEHLRKNIEHIKDIVSMQQSYARHSGFTETVPVVELIEDALRMNGPSLARHEVELVRDFQAKPEITTDKHKVMQILVNLVRNAKHACDEAKTTGKRIVVRTTADAQMVKIAVTDNGVGIPAENLTRIFNHGFTTKKNGHGFGLHSGALAAKEVGGKLTVESSGAGKGATFTLELPRTTAPAA